jgi:hypothetical protein
MALMRTVRPHHLISGWAIALTIIPHATGTGSKVSATILFCGILPARGKSGRAPLRHHALTIQRQRASGFRASRPHRLAGRLFRHSATAGWRVRQWCKVSAQFCPYDCPRGFAPSYGGSDVEAFSLIWIGQIGEGRGPRWPSFARGADLCALRSASRSDGAVARPWDAPTSASCPCVPVPCHRAR